ncbi:MAG: TetR/AcrR family transcriptional regulator [Chloroflexota bacterium]
MKTDEPTPRLSAEERRAVILKKSAELFAELGYHDASTKKLAAASGVTEPVIYQHFTSKKNLYITVVRDLGDLFSQSFKQQTAHSQEPSEAVILQKTLVDYYTLSASYADMRNIIFEAMAFRDDDISKAVHQNIQDIALFVFDLLEKAREGGRVASKLDIEAATWNYTSLILLINVSLLSNGYYGHNRIMFQKLADFWLQSVTQ